MQCIVQKFGGTSVATLDKIKHVAEIIAKSKTDNNVVAVVSAMAGVTNTFVEYVHNLGAHEGEPEYDKVVSSGEMITAGLLAIALKNIGIKAKSYASWQVPIITNDNFGRAMIKSVGTQKLLADIDAGVVPVVCGFQGVTSSGDLTTLGRGGSDFTAVGVASAINASICEIYSDVDGVYTVDPNLYSKAKRLNAINYDEMLEMAALGAKVLQEQSVAYAKEKNVVVRVASSFFESPGTIISSNIEAKKICGIAVTNNLANLEITYNADSDCSLEFADLLNSKFIHADVLHTKSKVVTLAIDSKKLQSAKIILKLDKRISSLKQKIVRQAVSKISVIGNDINEENVIMALQENKISVLNYHKSDKRLDLIVLTSQLLKSVSFLHSICGLDQ